MLSIQFQIVEINGEPDSDIVSIKAFAVTDAFNKLKLRIPIAKSDEEIIAEKLTLQMKKMLPKGILLAMDKEEKTGIHFRMTKEQFNTLGRPTIGDFLDSNFAVTKEDIDNIETSTNQMNPTEPVEETTGNEDTKLY